jgi:hypothetical protein
MPARRRIVLLLLVAFLGVGCASAAWIVRPSESDASSPPTTPADLYVSPAGSDTNPCSRAAPCASFDRAYRLADPGEVVEIAGGTYPPQAIEPDESKTSPEDVVFRAARGERVTLECDAEGKNCLGITGSHITVRGMSTITLAPLGGFPRQGSITVGREGATDVTLERMDVGAAFIAADDVTVRASDLGPAVDDLIRVAVTCLDRQAAQCLPENLVIEGNKIHHFAMWQDHQECLGIDVGDDVRIAGNHFDTCAVFAVFIAPEAGHLFRNVTIENNFFTNTGGVDMSTHLKISSHGGECENVLVRNNSFFGHDLISDCDVEGRAENVRFEGNLFGSRFECAPETFGTWRSNVFVDGSVTCGADATLVANAGFADPLSGDLHLLPGSPAVDAGDPDEYPSRDIDGELRASGDRPDAGADELG